MNTVRRSFISYRINNNAAFKERLLCWAAKFSVCCVLDSLRYQSANHSYDVLIGAGVAETMQLTDDPVESIINFESVTNDWIFGHLGYDALNKAQGNNDDSDFQQVYFFVPLIVIKLEVDQLAIGTLDGCADKIYQEILGTTVPVAQVYYAEIHNRINRQQFIESIQKIQEHIHRGDCYEINYCQEFYAESVIADPVDLYLQLTTISPNPFSCFYRNVDQYAICASPERYLKKTGDRLISQPIKGTAARSADPVNDAENRDLLEQSEKDRRENIIVVDMVRNDLSRICKPGSVVVEELCAIYDFPTVYQMISTVAGVLKPDQQIAEIINATFPMGSMTGAPKNRVIELIEKYELANRGLYSGTIGYIDPEKNFDFNVVIRTLFYNIKSGYMSYFAGAGITALSDPEQEYEECLLKASAIKKVFNR